MRMKSYRGRAVTMPGIKAEKTRALKAIVKPRLLKRENAYAAAMQSTVEITRAKTVITSVLLILVMMSRRLNK